MNATTVAGEEPNRSKGGADLLQLVSLQVGREEFGVDILKVQEIIRSQELTRVPNLPAFVEGVINLRGRVIPVVLLRRCFGLDGRGEERFSRIVVVEVNGTTLGFVVDAVSEVLRISKDTVELPPQIRKMQRDYIWGIGKLDNRLLLMLDLDRLMTQTECVEASQVN